MADPYDPRWWPMFDEVPGFPQAVTCSVGGCLVTNTSHDRGQHQLFHGLIWRLVIHDPNAVNEKAENEIRAWLHAIDAAEPRR